MIPRYTNAPFEGQPGCVSLAAGVLGPDPIPFVMPRCLPLVIPRCTPSPFGGQPGCFSLASGVLDPDPIPFVIPSYFTVFLEDTQKCKSCFWDS